MTSGYATETENADSRFGIKIGGVDITSGSGTVLSGGTTNLTCEVYSYKNLSIDDISQPDGDGLTLNLSLSDLAKEGNAVGTGVPTAVSSGELQIRTVGTYKLIYQFKTRSNGDKTYVVTGRLADAGVDESGALTNAFVMSKAPYESNYGETLSWSDDKITGYPLGETGGLVAAVTAIQSKKSVIANYKIYPNEAYGQITTTVGANRGTDSALEEINATGLTYEGKAFSYWEIRKTSGGDMIAKCYDPWFTYCMLDSYYISPVYEGRVTPADTGIVLTHLGYSRNRWTDENGAIAASGETDLLYTDFEIAFADGTNQIYGEESGYRAGVVFELCGKMGSSATFNPDKDYGFYSNTAALSTAIKGSATYYNTPNKSAVDTKKNRSIQCSEIDTKNISNKNRIEFAQYYPNAYTLTGETKNYTNSVYLMKATAYLVKGETVTLSNSIYICFKTEAARNLISD